MSKKWWGLLLILLAIGLLCQDYLEALQLSTWQLGLVLVTLILTVYNLIRKSISASIFFACVSFIILNDAYSWVRLSSWTMFLAALLISGGIHMLIKPKTVFERTKDIHGDKDFSFGDSVFYVNDDDFTYDSYDISFGNAKIYFDEARILGDVAEVKVDVSFGNISLYVPRDWRVISTVETSFGAAKIPENHANTSKTLRLGGEVSFGNLEVIFI